MRLVELVTAVLAGRANRSRLRAKLSSRLAAGSVDDVMALVDGALSDVPVHRGLVVAALDRVGHQSWLLPVVEQLSERLADDPAAATRWDLAWLRALRRAGRDTSAHVEALRRQLPPSLPLGSYDLGAVVGEGASASVHLAVHHDTGLPVAVKRLHRALGPSAVEDEARVLARMSHPGIVMLYEMSTVSPEEADLAGWQEGAPYLAMEYLDGGTLEDVAADLDAADVRAVLLALCEALGHAHACGVLHLDLKPANVLMRTVAGASTPVLGDFGVYSLLSASGARVAGTPRYMPPEQWSGRREALGPWSDLYSLGCMAYELWTGQLAFAAETIRALRDQHVHEPPPRLPDDDPRQAWLDRCLAKEPGDRFSSAREAAVALQGLRPGRRGAGAAHPVPAASSTEHAVTMLWDHGEDTLFPVPLTRPVSVEAEREARTRIVSRLVHPALASERLHLGPLPAYQAVERALRRLVARGEGRVVALDTPTAAGTRTVRQRLVSWARAQGVFALDIEGDAVDTTWACVAEQLAGPFRQSEPMEREVAEQRLLGQLRAAPSVVSLHVHGAARTHWQAWFDRFAGLPMLLVVPEDWSGPLHQRLPVPRCYGRDAVETIQSRIAVDGMLAARLEARTNGDVDQLLALLRDHLERLVSGRGGAGWGLPRGAMLPIRPPPGADASVLLASDLGGPLVACWAADVAFDAGLEVVDRVLADGPYDAASLRDVLRRAGWLDRDERFAFGLDMPMRRRWADATPRERGWAAALPAGRWAAIRRAWLSGDDRSARALLTERLVDWFLAGRPQWVTQGLDVLERWGQPSARAVAVEAAQWLNLADETYALPVAERALELDPSETLAAFVLGDVYARRNLVHESLAARRVAVGDPHPEVRARVFVALQGVLKHLERHDEAQAARQQALALDEAAGFYPSVMFFYHDTPMGPDDAWRAEHERLRALPGMTEAGRLSLDTARYAAEARWGGDTARWRGEVWPRGRLLGDVLASIRQGDVAAVRHALASAHASFLERVDVGPTVRVWLRRKEGVVDEPWPDSDVVMCRWIRGYGSDNSEPNR